LIRVIHQIITETNKPYPPDLNTPYTGIDITMPLPSDDHPTTATTTTPTLPPTKAPRPPIPQITPHLYLGSTNAGNSLKILGEEGITALISLEENRGPLMGRPDFKAHFPPSQRLFIACKDSSTQWVY
jgi:hypothetical protein